MASGVPDFPPLLIPRDSGVILLSFSFPGLRTETIQASALQCRFKVMAPRQRLSFFSLPVPSLFFSFRLCFFLFPV
jgi:hypothetical protein